MELPSVGEIVWLIGVVAWFVIRYPFARRAKRVRIVSDARSLSERVGLASASIGLAVVPGAYIATRILSATRVPSMADYSPRWWAVALGAIVFASALWVFRVSHKALGRNWSISLEIREQHSLVSSGPYALVRHPMYTSFLLMGIGQALLLSNWIVGLAGLIGFAILFFLRVDKEEHMMLANFGPQYRAYMERTKRIIPYLY